MAKLETQFSQSQGQELLAQLKEGALDYDQLVEEARTSKKKARKLRQVKALIAIVYEKGLPYLESLLNNERYSGFAVDEHGHLIGKPRRTVQQQRFATAMRF